MPASENQLIAQIPPRTRKRFLSLCEQVDLGSSAELSNRKTALSHAYFPSSGFISLVLDVEDVPALQVGMVGREAVLGCELVLEACRSPWSAVVHGSGTSWRIEAKQLRYALPEFPIVEKLLEQSLVLRLHQLSIGRTCERFHTLSQRLARWLLMVFDRTQAEQYGATQEFIAQMLGVRRVGVTVASTKFQKMGLLKCHRGTIRLLDRVGLEREACGCYAAERRLFSDLKNVST